MPCRFSNLSLLRRWLTDAPLVFAKASECTLLLDLLPPYACDATIIRSASGFLKSILQSDFVCFKFLIIGSAKMYPNKNESKNPSTAVEPMLFK